MRIIKIKIADKDYTRLAGGKDTEAECLNDNVSTSRHNRIDGIHEYESRRVLLRAYMRAATNPQVNVVSESHHRVIRANLLAVKAVNPSGLTFGVGLRKVGAAK